MKKEIAVIGLGKMGSNMARRLIEKGWKVVGYDRAPEARERMKSEGVATIDTYGELKTALSPSRIVWLFLPPKGVVDEALFGEHGIAEALSEGDVVVDGGNSFFKEAEGRAEKLAERGVRFMDVGTSGGPKGAREGACLMVGGSKDAFEEIEQLFKDFALPDGYRFFEGAGAGHFVKMVHNGIEYGMMQAIAEGFEILEKSDYRIDLPKAAEIYNKGSVIESRLIGWLQQAFRERGEELEGVSSTVGHTGEGEWTVKVAEELGITVPVIADSFRFRVESAKFPRYAGKVVSALREQFGGHDVKEK